MGYTDREKQLAYYREYKRRRRLDPAYRAKEAAYNREWCRNEYNTNPAFKAKRKESQRQYQAWLRETPEGRAKRREQVDRRYSCAFCRYRFRNYQRAYKARDYVKEKNRARSAAYRERKQLLADRLDLLKSRGRVHGQYVLGVGVHVDLHHIEST